MLGVLVILNVIFFMLCLKTSLESGFPVTPIDFCVNSLIYIVPNLLMICCVYTITALIFKNPLPAAPILFLHIIYSNMLTMKNDIYYMRPFSIMVRFPGRFFETHAPNVKYKSDYACNFISYISMYFCYNLEKEEGSLKTELKNCLSLYKIFYSCAFILILCVIHPIIYYEEIGSAIQSPIAFLTIIFCSDTYLMEVKSKRADVFHLYDQKKQLKVISQRVCVQILYLLILSCVGYVLFFWQKPGSVNEGISGIQIFLLYFIAMFGTIWLWSICSVILCTLLRNMWAGIGCLFGIVIGLISKAGSSFFGNLGLFSFSFCEPTQLMSESWIYGTLVSFIAGLFLFAVLPMALKKRG